MEFWIVSGGLLLVVVLYDLIQTKHAILRNFPLVGHLRYLLESVGPELRQYIVTSNDEELPFSRDQRRWVYSSAKKQNNYSGFGTDNDLERSNNYLIIKHHTLGPSVEPRHDEMYPLPCAKVLGGPRGRRDAFRPRSVVNISGMSFGSLSSAAVQAMNRGAAIAGCLHNTGEGGVSPHHLYGGDLIWQLGTGYFGARAPDGSFDREECLRKVEAHPVRAIEIKLSQGAKPGHGGLLPAAKVTDEIADTRQVPAHEDCLSPPGHSAFSTPREMLEFAAKMRELSGGKPVGIKLCVGMPHEVFAICKAMLDSGITLDFIVVDGGGGGTGAAPLELSDHVGLPLRIGLYYVNNALIGTGLKDKIKLAASEKVFSGSAIAMNAALGANWCNAARAFMFSLGCVQSLRCHTGTCPTGVATSSPARQRGLVIPEKAQRVANFQSKTLDSLHDIVVACGLETPDDFTPRHLRQWKNNAQMIPWSQIVHEVEPGKLLSEPDDTPFAEYWRMANPDTFKPTL